jgi:hypothetical protein
MRIAGDKTPGWMADIDFERQGPTRRLLKAAVINPLANYLPGGWLRALLRFTKSELAAANWADPGGWQSMVVSYEGRPRKAIDRILVGAGTMAMALRNRKRLVSRLLARLIEQSPHQPAHVLCLGAGPGANIIEAMVMAEADCRATMVDLSDDAFVYGRRLAERHGVHERVRFIRGDVRQVGEMLDVPPDVVKLIGICEYLTDEQIVAVVRAVAEACPPGTPAVFNSLSTAHGTDRFFRRVFGLHMHHRTPERMGELFEAGGFGDFAALTEPLGVYAVVTARRAGEPTQQETRCLR